MEALRLLIADDHEIVRKGLRSLLEAQPGWQVTAEASDGREAVEKARAIKPDVTVLDISMPALNGLEAARQMIKNDARGAGCRSAGLRAEIGRQPGSRQRGECGTQQQNIFHCESGANCARRVP